jgi:S-adenosylmethionine:tRNA ribosyltransferase-isomerase
MRVDAFQYDLPPELIAQRPAEARELARLLCLPDRHGAPQIPGALVIVNDTRVVRARLVGHKSVTGARVEVLLVRRLGARDLEVVPRETRGVEVWSALGKGFNPAKSAGDIQVGVDLMIRPLGRSAADGLLAVALWTLSGEPIDDAVRACGRVPLPPYIKREAGPEDAERYQTVYARHDGAIAAPTAGLHLTSAMLERLILRGCEVASVTLHVGLGTFQPVTADDFDAHPMHSERYIVSETTADAMGRARRRRAPVVAIGTTTVRALESAADPENAGLVLASHGETRLLIQPGYRFRVVDALLTNFHLPRSTLLALVCAFGGTQRVIDAYTFAVRERFRFFSYGDAMLLWRHA